MADHPLTEVVDTVVAMEVVVTEAADTGTQVGLVVNRLGGEMIYEAGTTHSISSRGQLPFPKKQKKKKR